MTNRYYLSKHPTRQEFCCDLDRPIKIFYTRDFAQTDPAPISSNLIGADQLLIGQKPGLAQKRKVSTNKNS
jgi:hypothetical protein